jgi:hypothetical protein
MCDLAAGFVDADQGLEEALGGVLLERNARQVALTRFGRFETASASNP